MPKYLIEAGAVLEVIESDLPNAEAVKEAIEADVLVNGQRISAYYHPQTVPVVTVRALEVVAPVLIEALSGGQEPQDAGQTNAAPVEPAPSEVLLRGGSEGSEVGAGEGQQDSQHGEGLVAPPEAVSALGS